MKTKAGTLLKLPTVLVARDRSRRTHFLHSKDIGTGSSKFANYQIEFLSQFGSSHAGCASVLGCLIGFDGVCHNNDIEAAYAACAGAAKYRDQVRIDWTRGAQIDARHISVFTQVAASQVKTWLGFHEARDDLLKFLKSCKSHQNHPDDINAFWLQFLRDAQAWLQDQLPPVLFGHVTHAACLSALPRSALVRDITLMAVVKEKIDENVPAEVSPDVWSRCFEAAWLGKKSSGESGAEFVDKLVRCLIEAKHGSHAARRSRILGNLQQHSTSLADTNEFSALLFAHAFDLLENGTRGKNVIAPGTPYNYLQSYAMEMFRLVDDRKLGQLSLKSYLEIFNTLLDPEKLKVNSKRAAGLLAFHRFLREWWTVPQLPAAIFKTAEDSGVNANLIWPHELTRIQMWLQSDSNSRFHAQLRCAFSILGATMMRIGELMFLRMENLKDEGDHIMVEVARRMRDGKEKTKEGRRRVFVRDECALKEVRSWLTRRDQEEYLPEELVFCQLGKPNQVAMPGKFYFWLNKLLKSATGDTAVSTHTMRHGTASFVFKNMLAENSALEINPMDHLANEAGHAGAHVTTAKYCHMFEQGLHDAIDRSIRDIVNNSDIAARWSAKSAQTLRQRKSRHTRALRDTGSLARQNMYLHAIKAFSDQTVWPSIDSGLLLTDAVNPMANVRAGEHTVSRVVLILEDLSAGHHAEQVALRRDCNLATVNSILKSVGTFSDQHGDADDELQDPLAYGLSSLKDRSGDHLGIVPAFARTRQVHLRPLLRHLDSADRNLLSRFSQYWVMSLRDGHFGLRLRPGIEDIATLLANCGLNKTLIAVRHNRLCEAADPSKFEEMLNSVKAIFHAKLGQSPPLIPKKKRAGRPAVWLVIASSAKNAIKDGSGTSMDGFNCLMLSLYVWLHLTHEANS